MILIEVNNQDTKNNFQLIEETERWAKENIKGEYTILLNPNLKEGEEIKITHLPNTSPEEEKGTE